MKSLVRSQVVLSESAIQQFNRRVDHLTMQYPLLEPRPITLEYMSVVGGQARNAPRQVQQYCLSA